ncbi:circadian input kinase A [Geminocystis sp. NIES-3708]|uniref:histidine kinase dimerization/phosphoacceptor domain -containing protein n=1 Tax=Geminocystis sp. NIES-3708 TaxID=1615909 RepID=UPI0005FC3EC7|nr:histidine kinase dimerization/phosphoacceptor domain -containing protein [Geminocystis sp. NIES-3708]BAQ62476.1 circadian input kinase A [Geminocystis sp. NIES-3708]
MTSLRNLFENPSEEIAALRLQLEEIKARLHTAEQTLEAIHSGEVDALVVSTNVGSQVFTLRGADHVYQNLVEQMGEGAVTISSEGFILYCNQQFSQLLNYPLKNLIGSNLQTFISPKERETFILLLENIKKEETVTQELSLITPTEKTEIPVKLSIKKLQIDQLLINSIIVTDISFYKEKEEKQTNLILKTNILLEEKEILLKEIHHRVKNNLQVIYSLLNLQSRSIKDPLIAEKFKESKNRVQSMALIHEHLYRSDDFSKIDLSQYIKELINILSMSYKMNNLDVNIIIDIQKNLFLDIDTAVPCGLIINELVSNALKYAFNKNKKGILSIKAESDNDQNLVLIIADNGQGLPAGFDWEEIPTLGLRLVKNLTNQLRGNITIEYDQGTKITLVFTRIKVVNTK